MAESLAVGRKVAMGIAEEVTYNTPVAPTLWLPVEPGADVKRIVKIIETGVLQSGRLARKENLAIGAFGAEFNIPMPWPVNSTAALTLLKHLFGKITTTGAVDKSHVFEVNPLGTFIGLTVTKHNDNHQMTASGCKIKSCALSAKINDVARMVFSGVGANAVAAAVSGTPSITMLASYPFWTFDKITAEWNSVPLALSGIDITFSNELFDGDEASYGLGSSERQVLRSGMFTIEGTLKRRFLNDNSGNTQSKFFDVASVSTHYPLEITLASGIGIDVADYTVAIVLDEVHCEQPELSTDAGILMETIKFKGQCDGTTAGVSMTVIDTSATPATATGVD